jgi:hypothetical protein
MLQTLGPCQNLLGFEEEAHSGKFSLDRFPLRQAMNEDGQNPGSQTK